jgi:hypothetical protein
MIRSALVAVLLVSLTAVNHGHSRNIPGFEYDDLFAKSDLVVIAQPISRTRDTPERATLNENIEPPVPAIGVVTQFEVLHVIKGRKLTRFTLHHYRLAPIPGKDIILNGPTFTTYKPQVGEQPFLMFLVRERDGRFAPVAGQVDPLISVQEIHRM